MSLCFCIKDEDLKGINTLNISDYDQITDKLLDIRKIHV